MLRIRCNSVFPLSFLSLGQFYKISQNWGSSCHGACKRQALCSCTKMIASGLKIGSINKKDHLFHKICWANFLKCWANLATYSPRANTVVATYCTVAACCWISCSIHSTVTPACSSHSGTKNREYRETENSNFLVCMLSFPSLAWSFGVIFSLCVPHRTSLNPRLA